MIRQKKPKISRQVYVDYLQYNYSDTTAKLYLWAFDKYHRGLLTKSGIQDYLVEKCFSESRNPLYMGFLKSFIQCFNMPYSVMKPKKRLPKKPIYYKFLTKEEVDYLISHLPQYYSMMVRLLFETGLRRNELINTKRSDINLEKRYIEGIGKGGKHYRTNFSINSKDLLTRYLAKRTNEYPFHRGNGKDYPRSFYYYLKKACDDIGAEDIHPHRLRHALGHHLSIDKEMPIQVVKAKLRHSSINSTEIYTVATKEETDERIEKEVFENG